jgi:benzoate/toluate 1,2-dioxygenase beta subunit
MAAPRGKALDLVTSVERDSGYTGSGASWREEKAGVVDANRVFEVEQLLFREAKLLDDQKLEEWLALFDDELRYWIPCNGADIDPSKQVSIVYDNRRHLEERIFRIVSGTSWAQNPRSRTCHLVTGVTVSRDNGELVVCSSQQVVELRRHVQTTFVAHVEHRLVDDDRLRIRSKRIDLLNMDEPLEDLTFIL